MSDPVEERVQVGSGGAWKCSLLGGLAASGASQVLLAAFLPCLAFGRLAGMLESRPSRKQGKISKASLKYCGLSVVCLAGVCLGGKQREEIRAGDEISGSRVSDSLVHCLCWPCALSQELHELELREMQELKKVQKLQRVRSSSEEDRIQGLAPASPLPFDPAANMEYPHGSSPKVLEA